MADFSFDVVSKIDVQELDNALNQTRKEIEGRFDFKNSKTTIVNTDKDITITTDDELKLKNVIDVLQSRANKRGISLKTFEFGTVEPAAGNAVRQIVTLRSGIAKDKAKVVTEAIKSAKLKVTTQFQDEQVRVSGKSKDDLQKAQALVKGLDIDVPLQFTNYR
ncbi:MAG: YajQ family cyclic di-GMP-binding protein [Vulcanimicrobiaceae bacterium]